MTVLNDPPSSSRDRPGVLTLLAAVLFGALLGISVDRLLLLPRRPEFGPPAIPGAELSPVVREMFVRRLTSALDLTEEQHVAVAALVEREYPRVRAAGDSARLVFERATLEPRSALLKILTPEQRVRFARMTGLNLDSLQRIR
ncbi:MAG: hypothetical protein IPF87_18275 [Gemmatimonadetes bacterium]|nr:hypothetical protein [Gemmatimonadota bacterium]